jgi:hypothetical protein
VARAHNLDQPAVDVRQRVGGEPRNLRYQGGRQRI